MWIHLKYKRSKKVQQQSQSVDPFLTEQTFTLYLLSVQESGEFAEGLPARTLPLRLTAVPTRRPTEGPDSDSTLCAFCSVCPSLPPSAPLLLRCLLTRPHNHPQSASHHGAVPHPDLPAQPQHSRAGLPAPNTGTYLPQPQPDSTATMAVVMSFTLLIKGALQTCHRHVLDALFALLHPPFFLLKASDAML